MNAAYGPIYLEHLDWWVALPVAAVLTVAWLWARHVDRKRGR